MIKVIFTDHESKYISEIPHPCLSCMKIIFPLLLFIWCHLPSSCQTNEQITTKGDSLYLKPRTFSFLTNLPGDFRDYAKITFTKKNLPDIVGMTLSTVILVGLDQPLTDASQSLGAKLKIDPNSSQVPYFGKNVTLFSQRTFLGLEGPHDLSSAMYFLGDGWVSMGIAGGFWIHGKIARNNKSKQVSSALLESLFSAGIATQFIKHITGRESPFAATVPGGKWQFFPNQITYHQHVPHYDAFPSGHIAAAMATVTVLSEFYPEKRLIRPIGYALMGVLMFAMLNNGVHWMSDYPLGIALGYSFAKLAVKKQKRTAPRLPSP